MTFDAVLPDEIAERFDPPVLLIVFNRLDTTKRVFEAIRLAKPKRLYIASDGARSNSGGDTEKVSAVREYLTKNIDWDCVTETLFQDHNLGCKHAVSAAITWFFRFEDAGIILEDDTLPTQTFFKYCGLMLERYRDDLRVGQVSGFNYGVECNDVEHPYFYSIYGSIWGWATWRRAWEKYDVDMTDYVYLRDSGFFRTIFRDDYDKYIGLFDKTFRGDIDTWDYQWFYTRLIHNFFAVNSKVNMVENLGFASVDATHTVGANPFEGLKAGDPDLKSYIPVSNFQRSISFDSNFWNTNKIINRIFGRIKRVLKS